MSEVPRTEVEPTQEQKLELEKRRKAYYDCKTSGCPDENELFKNYHDYATELLIDLSGKLDIPSGPEPELDEGYQKPGGWGSTDANPGNWKAVPMKDDPSKWKVVDKNGKNIATEFKTEVAAKAWIEKAKDGQQPPVPAPPSGLGAVDKFGITKIYKDKVGGQFNDNFKLEEKRRNYASGKDSEDSVEMTCLAKSKEQNSDVEATFYTKINSFKTNEADSLSDKLNGPTHQDGKGSWGIPDFLTDGGAKKTLECEVKHPSNIGVNPKPLTSIGGSIVGKWFGHKAITYVKGDKRFIESWIHFPVDNIDKVTDEQNEWRQYIPVTDITKYYVKANGLLTTCRIDGVKKGDPPDFKYCSVREIEPPS